MAFTSLGVPPVARSLEPWPATMLNVIEQAMYQAWIHVVTDHGPVLDAANEDDITDRLRTALVKLRRSGAVDGFNGDVFQLPIRDGKLSSGAGDSIDMMPDLTFYIVGCRDGVEEDEHDGFFIECKVLDASKGLSLYDNNGIARFVDGRYASRMPQAGLIAYALGKTHTCPDASMPGYMAKTGKGASVTHGQRLKWNSTASSSLAALGSFSGKRWISVHGRALAKNPTVALPDITLRHIWLRR